MVFNQLLDSGVFALFCISTNVQYDVTQLLTLQHKNKKFGATELVVDIVIE